MLLPLLTSCGEPQELDYLTKEETNEQRTVEHALLFYFIGTSLDSDFSGNISAVMSAVDKNIPGSRNRIVYFRRSASGGWAVNEIYYDRELGQAATKVLKSYAQPDLSRMGDYLADMVELVPAESYGVVFGGHGSGWLPKSLGMSWTSTFSLEGQAGVYVAPFGEAPREDALPTRFMGETGSMFDVEEIAAAMEATGVRFEYAIFDNCFMSNIESLYAMRRATDYIVASPCEIMAKGFPYKSVIPCLLGDKEADLEGVCRAFWDYYMDYDIRSGCVALTVCSELEALADVYRRLVSTQAGQVDVSQLQYYEGLTRHLFYDLGQYAGVMLADEGLKSEFSRQFDRTFPESCRLHTPKFYTAYGNSFADHMVDIGYYSGVTTSEPANRNVELNRRTEWFAATH